MSKSNAFENDFLKLIFQATAMTGIAQNHASPNASLYVSLHTADVGEAGSQTTNEIAYTSYARVAVARTSSGWAITDNVASNVDPVVFPQCTGGSGTATHFAVGTDPSGAGKVLYYGQLTNSLAISAGIEPRFDAGMLTVTEE